ncbi:hypothetical protein FNV43_RR22094 [Rhamnella rubrinervis]|uniref:Uncharacterized protein n=1 Tax=Rhamnella rubrinervis TaxID=2594499 RepID=A0A8K0E1B6_9ROSA|nr:hypothetical protein FNV43_RR22094 [Rhamnella rubrinervis]
MGVSPSPEMEVSVRSVERIIGYRFKNKRLVEEALTHSSSSSSGADPVTYQRLEFVGDAVISLAVSNYFFHAYPQLKPGELSSLRRANVSNEKLARVAVRHGLYQYVRRFNVDSLDDQVGEFTEAVREEGDRVVYGGSVKAPKILADIVESIAAAVYYDVNFDLQRLWKIFKCVLEPIITLEDLEKHPQPITKLYDQCQKQGKQVEIKPWKEGSKNVASVYVGGRFIVSASSDQREIARLDAAKLALLKLPQSRPVDDAADVNGVFEIEGAKHKLHEVCQKKKWTKPIYNTEKELGPPHERIFVCSVKVAITAADTIFIMGGARSRLKDAETSAASMMIRAMQESGYT